MLLSRSPACPSVLCPPPSLQAGCKLRVSGAQLAGAAGPVGPLDGSTGGSLQLAFNGCSPAPWDARLGALVRLPGFGGSGFGVLKRPVSKGCCVQAGGSALPLPWVTKTILLALPLDHHHPMRRWAHMCHPTHVS